MDSGIENKNERNKHAGIIGVIIAGISFLILKLKWFLIPLLKFAPLLLKTGGTMIISIFVYAFAWGWIFAVGLVVMLFIHEFGHLVAAKYFKLKVGAPVFIPFMGAIIALKDAPKNAWIEAVVGAGGPIAGTIGAFIVYLAACATGKEYMFVIAHTGFWLNLFNLIPISPLDGGRIVIAISPWLWIVGLVMLAGLLVLTNFNLFLLLIIAVSIPRVFTLFKRKSEEESRYYEIPFSERLIAGAMYFGLVLVLGFMMYHTFKIISLMTIAP